MSAMALTNIRIAAIQVAPLVRRHLKGCMSSARARLMNAQKPFRHCHPAGPSRVEYTVACEGGRKRFANPRITGRERAKFGCSDRSSKRAVFIGPRD
jgi:hypothetical protein